MVYVVAGMGAVFVIIMNKIHNMMSDFPLKISIIYDYFVNETCDIRVTLTTYLYEN